MTKAQEQILEYFRALDEGEARSELGRIIRLESDGAKIQGEELGKVFDQPGYDGREEVSQTTWDFADALTGVYRGLGK